MTTKKTTSKSTTAKKTTGKAKTEDLAKGYGAGQREPSSTKTVAPESSTAPATSDGPAITNESGNTHPHTKEEEIGQALHHDDAHSQLDATNREVPEPEVEEAPAELSQIEQEDYQAGREASQRGFPVRVCPHPQGSEQREVWLRGYHDHAHPKSNATVVPDDGNTEGGPYRGSY